MDDVFHPFESALANLLDLTVTVIERSPNALVGRISGSMFPNQLVHFKATPKVCTFLFSLSRLDPREIIEGGRLFFDLLGLNFKHPFGRIGIAKIPADSEGATEATVLVCETMFFWREAVKNEAWFKEKALDRLHALKSLADDAHRAVVAFRNPA